MRTKFDQYNLRRIFKRLCTSIKKRTKSPSKNGDKLRLTLFLTIALTNLLVTRYDNRPTFANGIASHPIILASKTEISNPIY